MTDGVNEIGAAAGAAAAPGDNADAVKAQMAAIARWGGYLREPRPDAWAARWAVNAPEVARLRQADVTPVSPDADGRTGAAVEVGSSVAGYYQPDGGGIRAPTGAALVPKFRIGRDQARDRILADNERIRALAWVDPAPAPARPGYLAGAPVVVKDLMAVRGAPFTGGSRAIEGLIASADAEVVGNIRWAGGVVLGTANLHELALGITSANPRFGTVLNPRFPGHIPGGSSGGSAAAIAAGFCELAVGTDTAGSIRIPAACCGLVGLKPTYEGLSRAGAMELSASMDHVGPMAADVAGCAALLAAMAGFETLPGWTRTSSHALRIGRLRGYFEAPIEADMRAAVDAACAALAADGASLSDALLPGIEDSAAILFAIATAEAVETRWSAIRDRPELLGQDVRDRLEMGQLIPARWYLQAQRLRARLAATANRVWRDSDILISATMRVAAPRVGQTAVDIDGQRLPLHSAVTQLTLPFNVLGWPALSLPWPVPGDGPPASIQLIGPPGSDWQLLAVARRLELARETL